MPEHICHIVGAGAFYPRRLNVGCDDLVIAADGGYKILQKLHIPVQLLIGDFDSLKEELPVGVQTLRHPPEKDDTDMALAIEEGLTRGYRAFHIHGGTGKRLDHTLANIQLLARLSHMGAYGYLFSDHSVITAITDASLCFNGCRDGIISVFAHGGEAHGVTLVGLKYPLENAVLQCDRPLGVSNAFVGESAVVTVTQGTLIVWWEDAAGRVQCVREQAYPDSRMP